MDLYRIKKVLQAQHTLHNNEWKGAVLFLCDDNCIYLIKRSDTMPTHGGQIAFFGGHKLASELTPWDTIQREFEEETGLKKDRIEFLGYLPRVLTAGLRPIVPVVARLHMESKGFLEQAISNGEWVELICYRWENLIFENDWFYGQLNGTTKKAVMFHTIRSRTYTAQIGTVSSHLLWGATASMVWSLLKLYFCDVAQDV